MLIFYAVTLAVATVSFTIISNKIHFFPSSEIYLIFLFLIPWLVELLTFYIFGKKYLNLKFWHRVTCLFSGLIGICFSIFFISLFINLAPNDPEAVEGLILALYFTLILQISSIICISFLMFLYKITIYPKKKNEIKVSMIFLIILSALGIWFFCWIKFSRDSQQEKIAQKFYDEGEVNFNEKYYRDALRCYKTTQNFHGPHTKLIDQAQEKEWICRAYLNDWTQQRHIKNPGSSSVSVIGNRRLIRRKNLTLTEDVRLTQPDIYAKYKTELIQITPVPDVLDRPFTPFP